MGNRSVEKIDGSIPWREARSPSDCPLSSLLSVIPSGRISWVKFPRCQGEGCHSHMGGEIWESSRRWKRGERESMWAEHRGVRGIEVERGREGRLWGWGVSREKKEFFFCLCNRFIASRVQQREERKTTAGSPSSLGAFHLVDIGTQQIFCGSCLFNFRLRRPNTFLTPHDGPSDGPLRSTLRQGP